MNLRVQARSAWRAAERIPRTTFVFVGLKPPVI
jgi:hypothetical protein